MLQSISGYLREFSSVILSFTEPVKKRLLDFAADIETKKLQPEQVMEKAKGIISFIDHAMNIQSRQLNQFGDKIVPSSLVPDTMRGQTPNVKEVIAEAMSFYSDFKKQTQNAGQIKFLPSTIRKMADCFDAVTNTLKAKDE